MSNFILGVLLFNVLGSIPYLIWYMFAKRHSEDPEYVDAIYHSLRVASVMFLVVGLAGAVWKGYQWVFPVNNRYPTLSVTGICMTINLVCMWITIILFRLLDYLSSERRLNRALLRDLNHGTVEKTELLMEVGAELEIDVSRICILEGYTIVTAELTGFLKPKICLPEYPISLESYRYILAHELIHYRSRDKWFRVIPAVSACIFWFNPAAGWILKSVRKWDEIHCDSCVCRHYKRKAYAITLVEVAEWVEEMRSYSRFGSQSEWKLNFFEGESSDSLERVRRIMTTNDKKQRGAVMTAASIIVSLLIAGTAFAAEPAVSNNIYKELVSESPNSVEETDANSEDDIEYTMQWTGELPTASGINMGGGASIQAASSASFDTDITGIGDWSSGAFWASSGKTISVLASITPSSATLKVGIVDPNGLFRYVSATGTANHDFVLNTTGFYRVSIVNDNSIVVHTTGYYTTY